MTRELQATPPAQLQPLQIALLPAAAVVKRHAGAMRPAALEGGTYVQPVGPPMIRQLGSQHLQQWEEARKSNSF